MNLAAIVPGYTALGFTKKRAIRFITGDHLAEQRARGKGNKAKRRQKAVEARLMSAFTFTDEPLTAADVDRMERYYAARRAPRVAVSTSGEF